MPIEEGFFEARDGVRLFYRFQAGSPGRNPLILIHGHGEHSGRYLKFFPKLADLGFPIGTFDLRGCGKSGGRPVYVSKFEDYLDDVSSFVSYLKGHFGVKSPVILFGNSLGGLIATAWARENGGNVSKLILSSPQFGIPLSRLLRILMPALNVLAPTYVVNNPIYPPWLSHDPLEVEKYKSDPLIQRRITVRLTHEMLRYSSFFQETETSFRFPVYILMAEEDFVVKPEATRRFFERVKAPAKEMESFPGFFHEIFNEVGQEKAFERLRHYLNL